MVCKQCKKELRVVSEQIGVNTQNKPIFHKFGYCDTCLLKYDMGVVIQNNAHPQQDNHNQPMLKKVKKDSGLSIAACICALFIITAPIAFILALVDLCINDKHEKHIGSYFALIFVALCIFIFAFKACSNNKNAENTSSISSPTTEAVQNEIASTASPAISNKEILFMEIPWGTSFSTINETHGELGLWGISGESYRTYSIDEIVLGDYQGIDFEYSNINIIGSASNKEMEVAGYTTKDVSLYFSYNIVNGELIQTEENSSLYGARYVFDSQNLVSMSADLTEKITSLYGEPAKTTTNQDLYKNQYTYTWWYGQNDTALVMRVLDSSNDTTGIYNDEITLSYVWLKGDELLQQANDWLKMEAIEKEETIYGNENTNGL